MHLPLAGVAEEKTSMGAAFLSIGAAPYFF
jgi:hypothetical protein